MKPFRVPRRVTVAGLVLLGMLPAQGSPRAAGAEALLRPTPLVLKDGRIANVSIHVLPFASGQAELAAEPAQYLANLTRSVGTDCFLTAQVIGHIASNEIAGDDTLNAHRLARSRADAVQASLIGGGLPAKAIASVWDWQFMVREPRATLWVFELTAGEDCEGRQLHGDLVAEAPATEQRKATPERVTKPAVAPAEPPAAPAAKQTTAAATPAATAAKPAATAAKPEDTAAKPAATAAKPADTVAKPAATAAKPAVAALGDPTPQGVHSSATAAAQPPVVARAAVAPPAPAQPQPEPGEKRQAAANLTETAPVAESKTVARAQPPEQTTTATAQTPAQPAEQPGTTAAQSVAAAQPAEPPVTAAAQAAAPAQPAEQPGTAAPHSAAAAQAAEPPATAAAQTVARAQPAEQAAIGAAPAASPQSPAKPSTDDGTVENGPEGGLIITFATNSSYFPSGAAARLRELLAGVDDDKRYQVTLQVAVSGTTQVVGAKSADEAARYNKWLAERRVERVQAWLAKNARAEALSIKPEYVANDDSRRLTVRLAPTG